MGPITNVQNQNMPAMGGGIAQGGAEILALLPVYRRMQEEAMVNGGQLPDFQTWLASADGQNALKVMPRR